MDRHVFRVISIKYDTFTVPEFTRTQNLIIPVTKLVSKKINNMTKLLSKKKKKKVRILGKL